MVTASGCVKDIDVFILCGGYGKRLRKISAHVPKPMITVAHRIFLDIVLTYLCGLGFRRFILGAGYKAEVIKKHCATVRIPGIHIMISEEKEALGTGGALRHARSFIKSSSFMVMNGDSFVEFDPSGFLSFHRRKNALASILLSKVPDGSDYGAVTLDRRSRVVQFQEKDARAKNCLINTGVYMLRQEIFRMMPSVKKFSLERDLFPALCGEIFGCRTRGYFIDIGTPERYREAVKYFSGK